ncbi:hypothetical protein cje23_05523, partial [Campylobacter jejuni subsp. jejuni 1997-11]
FNKFLNISYFCDLIWVVFKYRKASFKLCTLGYCFCIFNFSFFDVLKA